MSTQVVNPGQGQQDDFEAYLRGVIKSVVAEDDKEKLPQNQQQNLEQKQTPIVIDWGGQKYTFESQEQLNKTLNETFTNVNNTIQQLQTQIGNKEPDSKDKANQPPKFDTDKYAKLMGENPIEAQEYLDSHRYFGGQVEKPSEVIRGALQKNQELEAILAAYQFKENHRDYSPTPQNSQILGAIREQYNLPPNLQGLEASYAIAVQGGYIKPQQQQQVNQNQSDPSVEFNYQGFDNTNRQPFQRAAPPPYAGRQQTNSGSDNSLNLNDLENLSVDQLEKVIASLQK